MNNNKGDVNQQSLTYTQDMEKFKQEVQDFLPFATVNTVQRGDGSLYDYVGVYYFGQCLLTISRDEFSAVKSFLHSYLTHTQKGNTHV